MRFLLLLLSLVLQLNISGFANHNPQENHAQKTLTSENTFSYECSYNCFRCYDCDTGSYISQDPIRLAGNNPTLYWYVKDTNTWVDVFGLADFIVSPNGTVVPTNKDINLVSTSNDGDWFQIHFEHKHDGLNPHTHYHEKHDKSTNRRYRATIAVDLDYADKMLKDGKMKHRKK